MTDVAEVLDDRLTIRHIYISPKHNFKGHYGGPPGENPSIDVDAVECVEGKGLEGDRYFGFREDYKGQITFFDWAVHEDLLATIEADGDTAPDPVVYRRNVVTEGVDLNALIGKTFELQGVRFYGVEECSPCVWMNTAYGPGAEAALKDRGGLRAQILSSGTLRKG